MALSNGIRPPIDAPTISLPASFSVTENIGSSPINVTRSGNLTITSTVPYAVMGITAGTADYTTSASGTLIFAVGESVKTIPNSIIDDLLAEPTEQYIFILGSDDSTWVRGNTTCVISILDNDTINSIATQTVITISSPTAAEGANLIFVITLSGSTQQIQTFPFSISAASTATQNVDYAVPFVYSSGVTISGNNLLVPIGVTAFTATTLTVADSILEGTETVIYTAGGITSVGYITNVAPMTVITAISRMSAFETPYGMLSPAQQTASATSGGYITACASRTDTTSDNYAVEVSTTGPTGTYTRTLDNQQYGAYAEVNTVLSYQHANIPFVNEFDLPTVIPVGVIGLLQDANGVQELGLYSTYISQTIAEGTAKIFTGVTSSILDSVPISVVDGNTAKIFLLNNLAQGTILRASGTTVYLRLIPKLGAQEYVGAVTPIAVTIANRASKPLPPRNILFGVNGDLYSFPGFELPGNSNLTLQMDISSKTEPITAGYFNPSGIIETGITNEVDFVGSNGVYRTTVLPASVGGAPVSIVYTAYQHDEVDVAQGQPSYRFYAVKNGIRSLPFSYDLQQSSRGYASNVTGATASISGTNILIAVTTQGPPLAPYLMDYFLGGDVFTTQAFGTITCDSGVTLQANQMLQIPIGVGSFIMTVPTISATNKTLTTSWGANQEFPTSTLVSTALTAVTDIQALQNITTETYGLYENRFKVNFAAACNAGVYPYSFSGTATFGGAFGTTPLAGADYTVEAMYFDGTGQHPLTLTNSIINVPAGLTNIFLEIHPILDGITEGLETIFATVNGTTSISNNIISANVT